MLNQYINLDMLDYSTSYIIDNTFRMIADDKLLAQVEFWDWEVGEKPAEFMN